MKLKEFWTKTNKWLRSYGRARGGAPDTQLNNEGLIKEDAEVKIGSAAVEGQAEPQAVKKGVRDVSEEVGIEESRTVVLATGEGEQGGEPIERLQHGFNRLIERLQNINDNLNLQVSQHRELLERLDKMPELAKSFPTIVENQEKIRIQLSEQLSAMASSNKEFIETIEEIPTETAKQTEMLGEMQEHLAAAAEVDSRMADCFKEFNGTLSKLDRNTSSQTDSIMQMSKTFATSDRYLKYIISRQNKRFMWLFVISLGVCAVVVLALIGIIFYLNR